MFHARAAAGALAAFLCAQVCLADDAQPTSAPGLSGRTALGGEGLVRVRSALWTPRSVTFSVHGGWFEQAEFSSLGAVDDHYGVYVGGAVSPVKFVQVSLATRSASLLTSWTGDASERRRTIVAHDLHAGVAAGSALLDGRLGLALELSTRIPPARAESLPLWEEVTPQLAALASYDAGVVPVRVHLNVGYQFERGSLARSASDRGLRFAMDTGDFDRLNAAVGAEGRFRVAGVGVAPFVEYALAVPMGADGGFDAAPMRITPGVRITPWRSLFAAASLDVGVARQAVEGVTPVPELMALLSVGYQASFDGASTRTIEREVVREVVREAPPKYGTVRGVVLDKESGKPVADAAVGLPGGARVLTESDGSFLIAAVTPGAVTVRVERDGYQTSEAAGAVTAGKETAVEVKLTALPPPPPPPAYLRGTVITEADKEVQATLSIPTAGITQRPVENGEFIIELAAGEHSVEVNAKEHLAQGRRIVARPGETVVADFVLKKEPKRALVILRKEKIEIKKQVHFATNKAVILPDSFGLLDEVAAVILENPQLKLIRIEGHTDSQGEDAHNLSLSDRRAYSVMSALLQRGVDPTRLKAVGYGETRPLADNKSSRGRAKNRRVEFMIEAQ